MDDEFVTHLLAVHFSYKTLYSKTEELWKLVVEKHFVVGYLGMNFFLGFWDNVGVAHNVLLIIFKWLSVVVFAILRPYKWVLRPSENICCIIGSLKLKLYELRKETVWFLLTGKLISYWNKKGTFLLVFVVFEEMKYMLLYVVNSFISTLKWCFCSLFFGY